VSLVVGITAADAGTLDLVVQGPNDSLLVVDVLRTVRVEREYPRGYDRSLFRHWIDFDGDGCDTREQVLKRDAVGLPQVDPFRCSVVEADWISPYDARRTSDRSEVDIDHVVALKEAWDSGAWQWTDAQRTAFANDTSDPRSLIAVSSSSNRSKSDKDPSNWLPASRGYVCTYVSNWISVKARWNLSMDQSEWGRLSNILSGPCRGATMRGWDPPPIGVPGAATTLPPATRPGDTTAAGPSTRPSATTTVASASGSGESSPALVTVRPGAFCSPENALGSYNGLTYVCSKTDLQGTPYSGNRARWRRQS
jgi:hypothetical protein